jgi:hypothetical protein
VEWPDDERKKSINRIGKKETFRLILSYGLACFSHHSSRQLAIGYWLSAISFEPQARMISAAQRDQHTG